MKRAAIWISFVLLGNGCKPSGKEHTASDTPKQTAEVYATSRLLDADIDPFISMDGMTVEEVKQLFERMYKADQQYRDSLNAGRKENEAFYIRKMIANDEANLKILDKIVEKFGWPRISIFGKEAGETAWLIIWHHRGKRHILCRHFDLMEKVADENEMEPGFFEQIKDEVALLSPDQIPY